MSCKHSHVTVLAPIDEDIVEGDKSSQIKTTLAPESWDNHVTTIMSYLPMVHMARFQIIDHLHPGMGSERVDNLDCRYLMFIAEIDGQPADFFDHMYYQQADTTAPDWPDWLPTQVRGDFVAQMWGHCVGFPMQDNAFGPVFFRRFMTRYSIPAYLTYVGAPGACVADILRVLILKELTAAWQTLSSASMSRRYAEFANAASLIENLNLAHILILHDLIFVEPRLTFGSIVDQVNTL